MQTTAFWELCSAKPGFFSIFDLGQKSHQMTKTLAILLSGAVMLSSCGGEHFITDRSYLKTMHETLSERMDGRDGDLKRFFEVNYDDKTVLVNHGYINNDKLTASEIEAIEFLYAYMPLSDVTDYPTDYYLQNIRASFKAREEMPWGKAVPEMIFRHFVLPIRVNNENLDTSRVVFYEELKPRVENLSMKDAILEVNHWCHEKVTYQPSDARTSSPLATVKTSLGRCGEESTFTVAALRSVGIPARQVYTPRWAHTDDNHAWVEAWADGQWYFMGACEPEAVLNLGWFNAPASRGLLMHTKVFGHYEGPEEVMLEGPNYTEINLIDNYGSTARADVKVVDENGTGVNSAKVYFMIYNYAEFYPAVTKYTDAEGNTFLTAGKGDMLAWAVKDGKFGYEKISFGKDEQVTITISNKHSFSPIEFDIVPPPEQVELPYVSDEMRAENSRRTQYEDSLRHAYMDTFKSQEDAAALVKEMGLGKDDERFITGSMGNYKTILDFLGNHPDKRATDLLASLSAKDLRDITMENLLDSYNNTSSILGPRVSNEFLTPYKSYFLNTLSEEEKSFLRDPDKLIAWTRENIKVLDEPTAWMIPMSPKGVFENRATFASSRDVFFVSLARTLGINARIDPVTGKVQYAKQGSPSSAWTDVDFEASIQESAPQGRLVLEYAPSALIEDPQYYSHFSISKIVDGSTHLLSFDEGEVDMGGGVGWKNTFKEGANMDEGTYIIAMGNRLSDGSVPVTTQLFNIEEGKTTVVPLTIRESTDGVSVIGDFDSESKYLPADEKGTPAQEEVSILSKTGRGFFVVGVLEVGKEPTNHTLRDMAAAKEAFEKWGRPIILLCQDELSLSRLVKEAGEGRYGSLPNTILLGVDKDGKIASQIKNNMSLSNDNLPLFIIGDTFNKVYFLSQGYTIGIGDQMQGTIVKL